MRRNLIAIAIFSAIIPITASAQLVFKVCGETCPDPLRDPAGFAACQARISLCETKLTAYNGYMGQLGAGVTTYTLPAVYRDVLRPYYSGDISNWRFAFGDRQPPNNATTDCNVTYFNNSSFVNALKGGTLTSQWDWLFHELKHFSQCSNLGSRDAYAKMWFGHLELAFIQNNNLETLHDRMFMEADASNYSLTMMELTKNKRDIHNNLVRPIAVTLLNGSGGTVPDNSIVTGTTYRVSAKVSGGSDPLEKKWWLKRPGMSYFSDVTAGTADNGNSYELNTSVSGTYTLKVVVQQTGSNLSPASREVVIAATQVIRKGF